MLKRLPRAIPKPTTHIIDSFDTADRRLHRTIPIRPLRAVPTIGHGHQNCEVGVCGMGGSAARSATWSNFLGQIQLRHSA